MADALWLRGDVERGREFAERAVAIGGSAGEHEACIPGLDALAGIDWLGLRLTDAPPPPGAAPQHTPRADDTRRRAPPLSPPPPPHPLPRRPPPPARDP